jgi:hypothetical protein
VFITNPDDPSDAGYHLRVGEHCVDWFFGGSVETQVRTTFGEGCTKLEVFSANLERLFSVLEIIGGDQFFDPPETVAELVAKYDGDYRTGELGDPISGPDGIFTLNERVFASGQVDMQTVRLEESSQNLYQLISPIADELYDAHLEAREGQSPLRRFESNLGTELGSAELYFEGFSPEQDCGVAPCYLKVSVEEDRTDGLSRKPRRVERVAALPLAQLVTVASDFCLSTLATCDEGHADSDTLFAAKSTVKVNLLQMQMFYPAEFNDLLAGIPTEVPMQYRLPGDEDATTLPVLVRMSASALEVLMEQDLDATDFRYFDLDENRDGIPDGIDDFTPGPVSDDNIFCGSGLPGDSLQEAVQLELYSNAEQEKFEALFGEGGKEFPIRSPVYCAGAAGLVGATGQSLPFRRAGGDGSFGRRDFLWQSGQELAITFDKRNVFGFGLDFAEDTTRSAWSIEFSWIADARIPNTRRHNFYSSSDQFVLSVSIDRPTFFNFLNPNRSFFINLQFFLRYLSDYEGGKDDRDGNYSAAPDSISGTVILSAFTGYFQDRLTPRFTVGWDPQTSTAIALWGMNYRFTGNFSTSISMTHFIGNAGSVQKSYASSVLNPRLRSEGQSGLATVRDEDRAQLTARYSW